MATIKSYSDLQQSKKLAEILPLESADMCYPKDAFEYNYAKEPVCHYSGIGLAHPCWSLTALLNVLKDRIIFGGNSPEGWFCCYTIKNPTKVLTIYGDSLVDACYEMILKLHELIML